ncbi:MAG: protein kinase [Pseudomonadota bacterium]
MSNKRTEYDLAIGDAPQSLLLAMEQLVSGERSVAEFRDEMINLLYEEPEATSGVRGLVDDYAKRGLVPEQIHRLLCSDIDKATNEELPTTPTEVGLIEDATDALSAAAAYGEDTEERPARDGADGDEVIAPVAAPIDIGTMLRDRFEIVSRAPGGSMGVVYKAIDHRIAEAEGGRPYVAIKVLAPDYAGHGGAMRALQQEAAKGRYLSHPNIVRFLDLDRCAGRIFLVMEWLEGRALSTLLNERRGEPMSVNAAMDIVGAVGSALVHAHRVGVTHADVKPGNIMLLPGGGVKLLDFGIARARGDLAGKAMAFDNSFLQAATPAYASPAVLSGKAARPVDDVFSLACVTYRLLSGRRVFGDKTALDALREGLTPERIDGIGMRRWRALESALELRTDARTQSVAGFLEGLGVAERSPSVGGSWTPWLAGLAIVALAGVAILSPQFRSSPEGGPVTVVAEPAVVERAPPQVPFEVTNADPVAGDTEPAALTLALPSPDAVVPAVYAELRLFEDAGPSIIRLQRDDASAPQQLRLVIDAATEAEGVATRESFRMSTLRPNFAAGQRVVDVVVEHLSDPHVEPDAIVQLSMTGADGAVLARVALRLLDDDRQRVAATLAPDTVGFARPDYRVREDGAAAVLTVWRFNARAGALDVDFALTAIEARPDEDFVAPPYSSVRFEPGESVAVVYLPVVLDNSAEPEETLTITLDGDATPEGVYRTTTVRIIDGSDDAG